MRYAFDRTGQDRTGQDRTATHLTFKRFALAAGLFVVAALTALAPVGMFAAPGWAEDGSETITGNCGTNFPNYDDITYTYDKKTKVLTLSGTGEMKENTYLYFDNFGKDVKKVVIEEGITNIGESAFYEFKNMEEIEIGKDVKSIGAYAFQSCSSLDKVVLPEGLTTIGKMGFYRCSALEEIVIPESCQNIGEAAFESCKKLRSIKLPYGIAEIKSQTFKYCESLETIEIPESVEKIGVEAMYECKSLKSIDLPEKLTEIGAGAFAYNYALEEVKLPGSLETIGDKAFFNCNKLKTLTFPDTLESIGNEAFYGNNSFQSIMIPANVTCIGESAFIYCENVLSIDIAESDDKGQTIGEKAFYYCKSVTSVKIPSSVVSIGKDALFSIDRNAKIEYNGTKAQWKEIGGEGATSVTIVPSSYAYTITVGEPEHFDMIVKNFNTADPDGQATGADAGDQIGVEISNIDEGYYVKYVECSYDGGKTWTKLINNSFKMPEGKGTLIVRAVAEAIPSINYVTENNGESGKVKALPLNQYTASFINDNYSVYYIDGDYKSIDYSPVGLYNKDGVTLVLADDVTFETSAIMNSKLDYPNGIAYFSDITITKPVGAKGTGTISAYYIDASNITLRAGIIEAQNVTAYGANELSMREETVAGGVLTLDFSDENSKFCGSICDQNLGKFGFTVGSVVIQGKALTDGTNTFPPSIYTVGEINLVANTEIDERGNERTVVDYEKTTITLIDKDGRNYTVGGRATFVMPKADPAIATIPTASPITYGQTLAQSKLSNGVAKVDGTVIEGEFAWKDPKVAPAVSDSNKTKYEVVFTPKDMNKYTTASCDVTVTVNKANITPSVSIMGWTYGQTANAPSVAGNTGNGTVTYAYKVKDAADSTYSATVPSAVGSYTVRATVAETANYNGATATADFTISAATDTGNNGNNSGNGGGSGNNGNNTGSETVSPDKEPDPELTPEEQKAVEEAKKELEQDTADKAAKAGEAAKTVDTTTEGGRALADLMSGNAQGSTKETQAAALEVKQALEETGTDFSTLTPHDVEMAVQNKQQEREAKVFEAAGKVEDPKVPAATDLLARSDNAALKEANENLTVQPKLVQPEVLSADEAEKAAESIRDAANNNNVAKDVDPGAVQAAAQPGAIKTSADITIEPASKDLGDQTKAVEKVFNSVSADLAGANGGNGVVIATVLPKMTPKVSGFFPLRVNLRHLMPGRRLRFWPSAAHFRQASGSVSVSVASGQEGDFFFLDENGVPTATVSGDASKMTAVAYLTANVPYEDAFITADATTEKEKAALDDLAEKAGNTAPTSDKDGGGGCSAGFGGLALLALIPALALRRRK